MGAPIPAEEVPGAEDHPVEEVAAAVAASAEGVQVEAGN